MALPLPYPLIKMLKHRPKSEQEVTNTHHLRTSLRSCAAETPLNTTHARSVLDRFVLMIIGAIDLAVLASLLPKMQGQQSDVLPVSLGLHKWPVHRQKE